MFSKEDWEKLLSRVRFWMFGIAEIAMVVVVFCTGGGVGLSCVVGYQCTLGNQYRCFLLCELDLDGAKMSNPYN